MAILYITGHRIKPIKYTWIWMDFHCSIHTGKEWLKKEMFVLVGIPRWNSRRFLKIFKLSYFSNMVGQPRFYIQMN